MICSAEIFAVGSWNQHSNTEVYDIGRNYWQVGYPYPYVPHLFATTVYYKDAFYVFGTHQSQAPTIAKYSLITRNWSRVGEIKEARSEHSGNLKIFKISKTS